MFPEARHLVKVAWECMHIGTEQVKLSIVSVISGIVLNSMPEHNYSTVQDLWAWGRTEFHEDPLSSILESGKRDGSGSQYGLYH